MKMLYFISNLKFIRTSNFRTNNIWYKCHVFTAYFTAPNKMISKNIWTTGMKLQILKM